jgi:hypothetical protein
VQPLGWLPGGGAGLCPMALASGGLPTSSPNGHASSLVLRPGNTPSRFLPPTPLARPLAPLGCVGCFASFPTLQALCAHLDSPASGCTFNPDNCRVADADRHLLAPRTYCGRYFGVVAIVDTVSIALTAKVRPPNPRHAVLRFRAVGCPRCLPIPCPPPFLDNESTNREKLEIIFVLQ